MAASESGGEGEGIRSFLEQLQSSFVSSVIVGLMGPSPDAAPDRVVLVNPVTQGMIVMSGDAAMFSEILGGGGAPPASKVSIEALKAIDSLEVEGESEEECSICLDALWKEKEEVKEMPCKHRFHGGCIEKWLRMHGSCPMCRFQMPVEEGGVVKKGDEEGDGDEGARRRERVWVTIAIRREQREGDGDDSDEHDEQREA